MARRRVPLIAFVDDVRREQRQTLLTADRPPALTERQEETLDALVGFGTLHRRFPTYPELGALLGGVDRSNAYTLVSNLVARGYLSKEGRQLGWTPWAIVHVERLIDGEGGVVHEEDLPVFRAFLERVHVS